MQYRNYIDSLDMISASASEIESTTSLFHPSSLLKLLSCCWQMISTGISIYIVFSVKLMLIFTWYQILILLIIFATFLFFSLISSPFLDPLLIAMGDAYAQRALSDAEVSPKLFYWTIVPIHRYFFAPKLSVWYLHPLSRPLCVFFPGTCDLPLCRHSL